MSKKDCLVVIERRSSSAWVMLLSRHDAGCGTAKRSSKVFRTWVDGLGIRVERRIAEDDGGYGCCSQGLEALTNKKGNNTTRLENMWFPTDSLVVVRVISVNATCQEPPTVYHFGRSNKKYLNNQDS